MELLLAILATDRLGQMLGYVDRDRSIDVVMLAIDDDEIDRHARRAPVANGIDVPLLVEIRSWIRFSMMMSLSRTPGNSGDTYRRNG